MLRYCNDSHSAGLVDQTSTMTMTLQKTKALTYDDGPKMKRDA